jgi:putative nucleotidyltransferase with HDIG domain
MLQTDLGQIDIVMAALERRRPQVAAHCRRVSEWAALLATQIGLGARDIETIRLGGLLHDIGKMLVPVRVLEKVGRPNDWEWRELKLHPELGVEIAHRSGFDDDVSSIVLYHHERWDGQGYPDGLTGRRIPHLARIVSIMDAYDALTSARSYRERLSPAAAREMIARRAGSQFCPWIASAFLAMPVEVLGQAIGRPAFVRRQPEGPASLAAGSLTAPWRLDVDALAPWHC